MGISEYLLCQAAEGPGLTEVIVIMPLFLKNPEKNQNREEILTAETDSRMGSGKLLH